MPSTDVGVGLGGSKEAAVVVVAVVVVVMVASGAIVKAPASVVRMVNIGSDE
jgi:hypothetical protein